jgi:hypothetical protein
VSVDQDPEAPKAARVIREVVAVFAERQSLERAIAALADAGFAHSDLSLLTSHESIEAAGRTGRSLGDVLTGLIGEINYIGPLTAAGFIAVAAGPVGAALAGLIAAGVGGAALKEVLDEVTSAPHTEDFARALEAGSVVLWVRVCDGAAEETAKAIIASHGGKDIHVNERTAGR